MLWWTYIVLSDATEINPSHGLTPHDRSIFLYSILHALIFDQSLAMLRSTSDSRPETASQSTLHFEAADHVVLLMIIRLATSTCAERKRYIPYR